ncbi:MAG: rhodanese-like domain-containing protein [Acidimicrobiales bacterium]
MTTPPAASTPLASSPVTTVPAASSDRALAHFDAKLAFETDCWDVHASFAAAADKGREVDFVLLDVRSHELYDAGHVPGAISWPHGKLTERRLAEYPTDTVFVVYCAGPHCNGADKAAVRLARLGRPVKLMIGGIEGWKDEGFLLATATPSA